MRRALLASVLVAASALGAPAPASADTTIAEVPRPTTISAFGDTLAWSTWDPMTSRYSLTISRKGVIERATAEPRSIPFDVDLGPGPDGDTQAVYSRCSLEPRPRYYGEPLWPGGARGCNLYRYDLERRLEVRLPGPSSTTASEFLPSIWRGQIAFVRRYEDRSGPRGVRPYLYVRDLAGGSASRRLPAGATDRCQGRPGRMTCTHFTDISITGVDLGGTRIGFVRRFQGLYDGGTNEVRVDTIGRTTSRIVQVTNSGLSQRILRSPRVVDGQLYWVEGCAADPSGCSATVAIRRFEIATGRRDQAPASREVVSMALGDAGAFYVEAAPQYGLGGDANVCQAVEPAGEPSRCLIRAADPLVFTRTPPIASAHEAAPATPA